jgi:hypothetical protein
MSDQNLVGEFDIQMFGIWKRARQECNYQAARYFQMLDKYRGLGTAQRLLRQTEQLHDGFVKLAYECHRPDLTVEWLVLMEPWRQLFTQDQLAEARRRLENIGCRPPG